jgi:putative flippase GtrA
MHACRTDTDPGPPATEPATERASERATERATDRAHARRPRHVLLLLVVFACVGGLFNVLYGLLYVVLREGLDAQWANAVALVVSTIAGTWGHRRLTFGVRSNAGTVSHQVLGLALLGFSLVVTSGSLWLLDASVDEPSRTSELLVLAAANLGVGLVRFVAFRAAMVPHHGPLRRRRRPAPRR